MSHQLDTSSKTLPNGAKSAEAAPRSRPHAIQLGWLGDALHHEVKVRRMGFDQFSLAVWPDSAASQVLLFKHAIAFIAAAEQTSNQSPKGG